MAGASARLSDAEIRTSRLELGVEACRQRVKLFGMANRGRVMDFRIGMMVALMSAAPTLAQSKEAYVCIEEFGTAFMKDQGRYRVVNPELKKMIVVKDGDEIRVKYSVSAQPDSIEEKFICEKQSNPMIPIIQCKEQGYFMTFNTESMNFNRSQIFINNHSKQDPPAVSSGTCQKF